MGGVGHTGLADDKLERGTVSGCGLDRAQSAASVVRAGPATVVTDAGCCLLLSVTCSADNSSSTRRRLRRC